MNFNNFEFVNGWANEDRTCQFCGSKIGVKYDVVKKQDDKEIKMSCCNTCIVSVLFDN